MTPTLWHIPISHYSEKARWTLDFKGVEHRRHAPRPPVHMAVALALTRGAQKTFPVLRIDGRNVGDSTAIIAALEESYPKPALYPAGPAERARALELEDIFDEELGPHIRLLAWHELTRDPDALRDLVAGDLPRRVRGSARARAGAARLATAFVGTRYGVKSSERAELAREKVVVALDRLEFELGEGEYLVGERFSVADLTAAALFYPLVLPPEGPRLGARPPAFERFRESLGDRRGYRWVAGIYRRHRRRAWFDTGLRAHGAVGPLI